jgi:RNA polymerase sigma-70 factor (ECF subfamily)
MNEWESLAAMLDGAGNPALAELLREKWEAGGARWSFALAPSDFVSHLATHLPPGAEPAAHVRSLVAEDLYLACGCLLGQREAVAAFDGEYLARVGAYVAHLDGSAQFGDEMRQVLRERLLVATPERPARIGDYSGRGAMASWLRVTAVRIALNHRGSPNEARRIDDSDVLDELAASDAPELEILRKRHATALADALKQAVQALLPEQRVILRMYFSSGQSTERIAAALRVNRSTAARRLVAARQAVFEETRRLLSTQLPLDTDEFGSLARALHSQLNISLSGLLAERR